MSTAPETRSILPPDATLPPLEQLREVVATLRGPQGCPWDREQSHGSLRGGLLEEAYEVVAAIDAEDDTNLCEELGDLLLQVVFHSQLGEERGRFSLNEVARGIVAKLVRRHPHVFASERAEDSAAVLVRWDEIKRAEKVAAGGEVAVSAIDGVPGALPALMQAQQVQKKAGQIGFDWAGAREVLAKVREEISEVEHAMREERAREVEEEVGDLLFSVVNLARKLKIESEVALRGATEKFARRFRAMEKLAAARQMQLQGRTLEEMDVLWEEVKEAGS